MTKDRDHRSRVGEERRRLTRMRLVEAAMLVFAARGVDGPVIDEVIATASVSRGTFYNYFRSNQELLEGVATEVANQMLRIVNPLVLAHDNPAARVATGVRLMLLLARRYPHLAAFMVRVAPGTVGSGSLAAEFLARDLKLGQQTRAFQRLPAQLAYDLVSGPVLVGFHTLLSERVPARYDRDLARCVLLALGVRPATARRVALLPLRLPQIPDDSLLERAAARSHQLIQMRGASGSAASHVRRRRSSDSR